jgi:hypothetical protein
VIEITSQGSWDKTDRFLARLQGGSIFSTLDTYARRGVEALSGATPRKTGQTAGAWNYEIQKSGGNVTIFWTNNHLDEEGTPIAIMLQYGHGTGTGGYVQGRDYINPAIRPIFDEIANAVWKEVTSNG